MSRSAGRLTRREAILAGAAAGVSLYGRGLEQALAAPARCASRLSEIEHVVFLVQENRSFDHLFGTLRGVRGFSDHHALSLHDGSGLNVFAQPGYEAPGYGGHLYPFRLEVAGEGECVNDITHDWGPQHRSWNGGAMDGFVREHLRQDGAGGAVTRGYYTRDDLPFLYALADAFTICDAYHCSVLGPSDPNHAHIVSGTIDPSGQHGGPLVGNRSGFSPQLSWTTMPEQLRGRGVSWKVYSSRSVDNPVNNPVTTDSPFPMFTQYFSDPELRSRGIDPRYPEDFTRDVSAGELPQVSWIYADIMQSDHPPFSIGGSAWVTDQVLQTLTSRPEVWAKTALLLTWDENGGFCDHVRPPTPSPGTHGEYVTVSPLPSAAEGIAGPIGLGMRVPLLIISPFTQGGFVCSERFDHTSLLRFLERRFGAEVPNLSQWRRSVTGDLVSAFNFAAAPQRRLPRLPTTSPPGQSLDCSQELAEKVTGLPLAPVYPVPANRMPRQEPGRRKRSSGCRRRTQRRRRHRRRHRSRPPRHHPRARGEDGA
jgi:phospholipase C